MSYHAFADDLHDIANEHGCATWEHQGRVGFIHHENVAPELLAFDVAKLFVHYDNRRKIAAVVQELRDVIEDLQRVTDSESFVGQQFTYFRNLTLEKDQAHV